MIYSVTSNSTIVAKFLSRRLASLSEGVTEEKLDDNDSDDETVDSEYSRHNDCHEVFNDSTGVVDSHGAEAHSCFPGSPCCSPVCENDTESCAEEAAVREIERGSG